MKQLLFGIFLLAGTVFVVTLTAAPLQPIQAQGSAVTQGSSAPVSPATESPTSESPDSSEAATQTQLYRQQLVTYRDDYQAFTIARQENLQLATLASLEQAVKATRQVMLSRDDVLQTHMKMVRQTLSQTFGLELQRKNDQLASIDQVIETLKKHRQRTEAASDRARVATAAQEFEAIGPQVSFLSSQTVELIAYGRIQSVYDKTVSVKDEIKSQIETQEKDPLRLAEKQRAMSEIEDRLSSTGTTLQAIRHSFDPTDSSRGSFEYSQLNQSLESVYAGIYNSLSYLHEVLGN